MANIVKALGYSQTWTYFEGDWHDGNAPIMGPRTHAAWLGSTVFDGARAFEGVAPDLDRHCARVNWSASNFGLKSVVDVEAWIANKAASKFARRENAAFVNGDGVRKPKGFLQYTAVATDDATRPWGQLQYVPSGKADGFAATNPADCFIDMIYAVKAGYRQGANFISARKTLGQIRKLKDGQGNYLVDLRLRDGALVETIFGYAVADGEDMPQLGANTLPLAFGNFAEAYTIVDRLGTSVIRDNITVPGFVKFHMRRRTGGGMVNFEALKLLKIAAS